MSQQIGERQTIWGWKIAAYLFLAGAASGAYVTGVAAEFAGDDWDTIVKIGVTIGGPVVAFSTLFLIWDLGRPFGFYRAGFHPRTSWISRGVSILTAFIFVALVHMGLTWGEAPENALRALGVISGVLAVMTMIYTGLLLGSVRSIPLWSTPALPLLFLVSALSTGVMAVSLTLSVYVVVADKVVEAEERLLTADSILLVIEAVVVFSYLYLVQASMAARASVESLLRGELAILFWVGFVVLGLMVPLALELTLLASLDDVRPEGRMVVAIVAFAPGILGGYVLRHLVVAAAIKGPLVVIGRLVPIPGRPRLIS